MRLTGELLIRGGVLSGLRPATAAVMLVRCIAGFLRPVSGQNLPAELLSGALKPEKPLGPVRRNDGKLSMI